MQHILHSNKFIYAVLALGALFFAGGLITYTGSAATYAVFTLIFMLTLASGFYGKFSYSYFFLVIFIWLGFWLKLTVHSIFDYTYVEPTGIFDGSSSSWDEVLWVAIAAGAGVMVGRLSYARLVRNSGSEATGTAAVPAWYPKFRNLVWAMMLLVMISIAAGNAFYGIQQIGMVPRTVFPWPFNAVIAWMTSIGSAMGVATLVWWDIVSKRKFSTSIYAILLEACLSTVSLLSRGVYIFHTIPQLLSLHKNRRILSGTSFRQVIVLAVVFVSLFVGTMAIINVLRGYLYPHQGLTISTSINQMRMALTLADTHDRGAGHVGEPERAAPSAMGMAWVVVFAFAARCARACGQPWIARSTRTAAGCPSRRTGRALSTRSTVAPCA